MKDIRLTCTSAASKAVGRKRLKKENIEWKLKKKLTGNTQYWIPSRRSRITFFDAIESRAEEDKHKRGEKSTRYLMLYIANVVEVIIFLRFNVISLLLVA